MDKLNPNDFLFGDTPDEARDCITNEYNSTVNLTSDQIKKIQRFCEYRYRFFMLSLDDRYIDYGMQDYYSCTKSRICNFDFDKLMVPLTFKFNCMLYHELDKTVKELEIFSQFVISHMVKLKNTVGKASVADRIITDSNGRDLTNKALGMMEKCLIVAEGEKTDRPIEEVFHEVYKGDVHLQKQNAINNLYSYRKKAKVLIDRIKNGTFPYDENGQWRLT